MEHAPEAEVTRLLESLGHGDRTALERLFPLLYEELRALAHRQRRRWRRDDSLNTTALVHETYLKLADQGRIGVTGRAHFLATTARAMRHILVNHARDRRAQKRGGGQCVLSIEELGGRLAQDLTLPDESDDLVVALGDALERLERVNKRQSRIVECRYFGGMSVEETAVALGLSTATVSRGWGLARVRLYQELQQARGP